MAWQISAQPLLGKFIGGKIKRMRRPTTLATALGISDNHDSNVHTAWGLMLRKCMEQKHDTTFSITAMNGSTGQKKVHHAQG